MRQLFISVRHYWIRGLIIGLITIFLLSTAGAIYIYAYGQTDHAQKADVIIVLGAGVRRNGSPNAALIRRVRHGAALYRKGLAPYILCTGGFGSNRTKSEATACLDLLRDLGIPDRAILIEEISNSTEENAIEAQKVMEAKGFKSAVLVTDNFHLLRAEMLFRMQGIEVYLSPAQITSGQLSLYWAVISTYREVGGFVWYAMKSVLGLPYTESPL